MAFELPKLKYAYDALEPYIDAKTMDVHYNKHHGGYTSKLNAAIEGTEAENLSIEDLLANISKYSTAVRNNGGGYFNHNLFWDIMSPKGGGQPEGELLKLVERDFGSFGQFKKLFADAAATRFGSGWAWLILNDGKLEIGSTPNQDNPLMDVSDIKGVPILGLDVWEHAYYLNYQNRRPDYIDAFWNVVDWKAVSELFNKAK